MKIRRIIMIAIFALAIVSIVVAAGKKSGKKSAGTNQTQSFENPPKGNPPDGMPGDGNPPAKPGEEMSDSNSEPVVVEGADSITYTYKTSDRITKTYYAKYLVDGTTLDLSYL